MLSQGILLVPLLHILTLYKQQAHDFSCRVLDVGIGREVAELQATELELSSAMLATHVSLKM